MLILSRKEGERIMIQDKEGKKNAEGQYPVICTIMLVKIVTDNKARLGIAADPRYVILREEVQNKETTP